MTILERFKEKLKDDDSVGSMIRFISVENAKLLVLMGTEKFTYEEQMEVFEFYNYFMSNHEKETRSVRFENWGREPLILRIGQSLALSVC